MPFSSELPEMDDDLEWRRIINDPRPHPVLTALGDETEKQFKTTPPDGRDRQTRRPQLHHLLEMLGKEKVMARIDLMLNRF